MRTTRIALLAAGLLAAAGTIQAQAPSPGGPTPSTQTRPDADKSQAPSGAATQGVEGRTGSQSGPDPAAAKDAAGPMPQGRQIPQATDSANKPDADKAGATQGVPASQGAQGGPKPAQADSKPDSPGK